MALWSLSRPPKFKNPKGKELVATKRGWADPDTGEVLVAISNLTTKGGAGDVTSVAFDASVYVQGDAVDIIVHFNEKVDVTNGATIEVSWSGNAGNFTATALAQNGVYDVVFSGTIPLEDGIASIAAQSIIGTIADDEDATATNLAISAAAAALAGTREVAAIAGEILSASFDAGSYLQSDPISVDVVFSENVNAEAGATILVSWSGTSGDFVLTAAQQLDTDTVTFTGTVPAEAGTLSLDAQTLTGDITDENDDAATDLDLSQALADAAGDIVVA